MSPAHRPISLVLAVVMTVTSVLNVLFVTCLVDAGHHEIEMIGHQLGDAATPANSVEPHDAHDLHADGCADRSLIADLAGQRGADHSVPVDIELSAAILPPAPPGWRIAARGAETDSPLRPPGEPARRPALADLATIRLLI